MKITDEDVFLDWCRTRGVEPKLKSHSKEHDSKIYIITPLVEVKLAGRTVKLSDDCTVYFHGGEWGGGTNWLWANWLPWIQRKQRRFHRRINAASKK